MPIVCIGINYRTAPVALREQLSFSPGEQADLLRGPRLRAAGADAGLGEFVLLSTCNRTELYAAAADVARHLTTAPAGLAEALAAARGLPAGAFAAHLYGHASTDAVRHLCRVASGLDSMVLGESEVLGQVADAFELARREGAAGRVLGAVFHTAIRAGRRARTETGICRCPMSVSSESVRALRDSGWEPAGSRVLVVGTGKMSRLAGEVLRGHGVHDLRIIGRTAARAEAVARALDATPLAWHRFESVLPEVDVVFCATSAPHAVVTRERVAAARTGVAAGRPLRFIDIAVPRDVEPAVRDLPGVTVFDLDDLQRRLTRNLDSRRREVPAVDALVEEELRHFEDWRHGAELRPLLAAMHQQSEEIRQREVARALRRLKGCTPEMEEHFHAFSRSLVNKLLHAPTRRLRDETDPNRCDVYVRATRDLFGLDAGAAVERAAPPADGPTGRRTESAA